jgi:hypothetical protein
MSNEFDDLLAMICRQAEVERQRIEDERKRRSHTAYWAHTEFESDQLPGHLTRKEDDRRKH